MILFYQDRILQGLMIFVITTATLIGVRIFTKKRIKMKFFRFSELILLGVIIVLCLCGYFGKWVDIKDANTKTYSKEALQKDLYQLEDVLFSQCPLYYTDTNLLKQEFENIETQIKDNMTEEEFYRLVNPLVVMVQCGHTNLSISKALQSNRTEHAKFLPIEVYAEGNILMDKESNTQILSINGKPADQIIDTLLRNISHDGDNLSGAYYILNLYFPTKYYDFIEQPSEFLIEYQDSNGVIGSKVVAAEYNPYYNENSWDLRMAQYTGDDYYSCAFTEDIAILRIKAFLKGNQSYSEYFKDFFNQVEENQIKKVIIDVRGNFGGNQAISKELLSYLITEPFEYFRTDSSLIEEIAGYDKEVLPKTDHISFETELLIDGAGFSTCGHFAAIFQSLNLGVIKGQPTGGGSLCTDGSRNMVLYQTGLRLHYSTKVYEVNADCEKTNIVCPDEVILLK